LNQDVDVINWSPCGINSGIMNINSEVRITPITTSLKGVMTVSGCQSFTLLWRMCE
jgi:hypothetical protein